MTIVFNQKIFRKSLNAKSVVELIESTSISTIHNINIETLNSQRQFLFDLLQKQSINETSSILIFQHKISSTRSKNNLFCLLSRIISEFELTRAQRLINFFIYFSSLRKRSKLNFKNNEIIFRKKIKFDLMITIKYTFENEIFWQFATSNKSRFFVSNEHQLTVSFIKLSINDLNENNNQNINDNISIEKISGKRKLRRMLSHIKRNVLSLTTINHFKLIQKFELKINLIKKDCFAKTLQIRHSIRKKMKWFFRASFSSQVDKIVHYSTFYNIKDRQLTNNEKHKKSNWFDIYCDVICDIFFSSLRI